MKNSKSIISVLFCLIISLCFVSCTGETSGTMSENTTSSVSTETSADNSSNTTSETVSEVTSEEEASDSHNHDANTSFVLNLEAVPSETEPGIINAVITLSHVHTEIVGVQFKLTYTSNTVEGVYTTNEDMVKTMTVVPTYETTFGVPAPRYEQICRYNKASSLYECMYVDMLSYPSSVAGQKFSGLKNDGELVITIPFKVNSDASVGNVVAFDFVKGSISGTSAAFEGVGGDGNSASYTLTEKDIVK